jgi:hypothetical protein
LNFSELRVATAATSLGSLEVNLTVVIAGKGYRLKDKRKAGSIKAAVKTQ